MLKKWVFCIVLLGLASYSYSAVDVYDFDNDDQRKRYQFFLEELRCPKCKNNNLAGTNSQIAVDLRRELHKMVMEGKTDEQIIDFMVTRYGDFVLYRPPLQENTVFLWVAPLVFLLIGGISIGLIVYRRRKFVNSSEKLTEDEKNQLAKILSTTGSAKNK